MSLILRKNRYVVCSNRSKIGFSKIFKKNSYLMTLQHKNNSVSGVIWSKSYETKDIILKKELAMIHNSNSNIFAKWTNRKRVNWSMEIYDKTQFHHVINGWEGSAAEHNTNRKTKHTPLHRITRFEIGHEPK